MNKIIMNLWHEEASELDRIFTELVEAEKTNKVWAWSICKKENEKRNRQEIVVSVGTRWYDNYIVLFANNKMCGLYNVEMSDCDAYMSEKVYRFDGEKFVFICGFDHEDVIAAYVCTSKCKQCENMVNIVLPFITSDIYMDGEWDGLCKHCGGRHKELKKIESTNDEEDLFT